MQFQKVRDPERVEIERRAALLPEVGPSWPARSACHFTN